jgi:hypothetical protein
MHLQLQDRTVCGVQPVTHAALLESHDDALRVFYAGGNQEDVDHGSSAARGASCVDFLFKASVRD